MAEVPRDDCVAVDPPSVEAVEVKVPEDPDVDGKVDVIDDVLVLPIPLTKINVTLIS